MGKPVFDTGKEVSEMGEVGPLYKERGDEGCIWRFICVRNVTFMPRHN